MKKVFCIIITLVIALGLTAPVAASTPYTAEQKGLSEALPFEWESFIMELSEKPSINVYKECDKITRDVIDEMGQVIYFSKEYCDSAFDDYDLGIYIRDEKSDSVQLLWTLKFGDYGSLIDSRSGETKTIIMNSLDDLCDFFPALSLEISESRISPDSMKIYDEVMNELCKRMNESEDKIYDDLAPKYGMTSAELRDFMFDTMVRIYSGKTSPADALDATAPTVEFDFEGYKAKVLDCVSELNDGCIALANMCQYENNYWKALESVGGHFDTGKAVSSAFEWLEGKSDYSADYIDAQYKSIGAMYKEVIAFNTFGREAEEIGSAFNDYYDAYIGLYNLAMSPSGGRGTFVDTYNNLTSIIKNCQSKLDNLLT